MQQKENNFRENEEKLRDDLMFLIGKIVEKTKGIRDIITLEWVECRTKGKKIKSNLKQMGFRNISYL
tara:strand:+ start:181 stop:381 length:201 start_codon:yes stop_codon:yes gene_type:complete